MYIISGMHRSGTSLVARLFYEAGADLGDPETFYRPDKWNPDGYFEQPDIHAVNMPLIDGIWWKFAYFFLPSTRTIIKRSERYSEEIKRISFKYYGKVVKETRFCLTLPAWLKHGARLDKILICLRDPIQVARSVRKRNSVTINRALNLWYIHNIRLLENAKGIPLWFIYYDNLLNEERSLREIKSAFHFFEFNFSDKELLELHGRCVKPQMNHNPEKTASYPRKIEVLWGKLLSHHKNQFNNFLEDIS